MECEIDSSRIRSGALHCVRSPIGHGHGTRARGHRFVDPIGDLSPHRVVPLPSGALGRNRERHRLRLARDRILLAAFLVIVVAGN